MDDLTLVAQFSNLVGLIYDCALDPSRWPIVMEVIRLELGFHNATLDLMLLPSGKVLSNVVCNVPDHYAALIPSAGADVIDQWGGVEVVQGLPLDRPAVLTHVNPAFDANTSTNPYYVQFAKPQGIIDVIAVGLARDARAIGSLSFGRHESAGPIGDREVALIQMLVPHLQRAATINRMLEEATAVQAGFAETMDTLTCPVFLVAANLRIVHANSSAMRLLRLEDMIRSADGRLEAMTLAANKALVSAVAQAVVDESALARRGLGIPIEALDGRRGALHLLPLRKTRRGHAEDAVAAMFVADVATPFVPPTDMVAALFDLTPAEARVFDLLVSGSTLTSASNALGVERSTVKTHLLRLYAKIGVRSQPDLVRIAAALSVPAEA